MLQGLLPAVGKGQILLPNPVPLKNGIQLLHCLRPAALRRLQEDNKLIEAVFRLLCWDPRTEEMEFLNAEHDLFPACPVQGLEKAHDKHPLVEALVDFRGVLLSPVPADEPCVNAADAHAGGRLIGNVEYHALAPGEAYGLLKGLLQGHPLHLCLRELLHEFFSCEQRKPGDGQVLFPGNRDEHRKLREVVCDEIHERKLSLIVLCPFHCLFQYSDILHWPTSSGKHGTAAQQTRPCRSAVPHPPRLLRRFLLPFSFLRNHHPHHHHHRSRSPHRPSPPHRPYIRGTEGSRLGRRKGRGE